MADLRVVRPEEVEAWSAYLTKVAAYDFYDLPSYHALAERRGEGEAVLLAFEQGRFAILLPLLLRAITSIEGLEQAGAGLHDATSVYGYSGPLLSAEALPPDVIGSFQEALIAFAKTRNIVSIFSRLHPLRPGREALAGLGEVQVHGPTVSIDLTLSEEEQWRRYRNNHRRNIAKLRAQGYECSISRNEAALAAFSDLYRETMERRDAHESYFFDDDYFRALLDMGCFDFVLCHHGGAVAAGALVSRCNGIAQYHLGGTVEAHLQIAPMKLVFDEARRWAAGSGCSVLHLGGGLGAQCDSLFNFKAGFSDRRHEFSTWRWIVDEERSADLEEARSKWAASSGRVLKPGGSFPPYRGAASPTE